MVHRTMFVEHHTFRGTLQRFRGTPAELGRTLSPFGGTPDNVPATPQPTPNIIKAGERNEPFPSPALYAHLQIKPFPFR